MDESTDQSDTAQSVIFIRGIDENFNIIEEMLDLCHVKGTTTGKDIYEFDNLSLDKFNIDRKNIYSITTDGAPVRTGKHNGFITLFKESVDHNILRYHCLIHQQQLCAQKLNMKHLMTDLVKAVNFIRSQGLTLGCTPRVNLTLLITFLKIFFHMNKFTALGSLTSSINSFHTYSKCACSMIVLEI